MLRLSKVTNHPVKLKDAQHAFAATFLRATSNRTCTAPKQLTWGSYEPFDFLNLSCLWYQQLHSQSILVAPGASDFGYV
jgi:hypothetical protein